ncbi:MAG TPA: quinone oxidoreductase [Geminicoccus sp.]|jgi:NADPH2:quinone reductase|uniref:quinone oxidoreductase family protein n=1 Tax=Geminicoccus sp. TaxID=2024832 RepID=UPI002E314E7B|nr:quinone oxidoreductase [Geminicoccus sp.]HEX2526344.1 quinone oxidoreductase [Geminicoccus sp.]
MATRVILHRTGGPEVLETESYDPGKPAAGEVLIRQAAIGLNFIDCYFRSGLYPTALPYTPGFEASGVIEAVGEGVADLQVGQRIAYGTGPAGAYTDLRVMPAASLVPVPDSIPDDQACAMMLKGMTAQYLLRRTFRVQAGQTILIHAAAGGVGLLVCQWARHLGATVIGTVSSDEKAALAKAHGCDHPIVYTRDDFVAAVKELTGGKGVDVVYDSVGKDTFMKSLDCLKRLGMMVTFGQSSGKIEPFDTALLAQKGSLFLTRPTLFSYVSTRDELLATANDLIEVVASGAVKVEIDQTYKLADVAQAHRDLESRKTTGCTILTP